jgi:hypothetical protein
MHRSPVFCSYAGVQAEVICGSVNVEKTKRLILINPKLDFTTLNIPDSVNTIHNENVIAPRR